MTDQINPKDPYGFANLGVEELRKMIADEVKNLEIVEQAKKDYVGAVNDTVKEGKTRVKKAVEFLRLAEAAGKEIAIENATVSFLKTATNQGS